VLHALLLRHTFQFPGILRRPRSQGITPLNRSGPVPALPH
jgi:hypothetical protein